MTLKRGTITFVSEGQHYQARLSTNAMVAFQEDTGQSVLDAFASLDTDTPDIKLIRDLMYHIVIGDHSREEIGDMIDDLGFEDVGRILGDCGKAAFPQPEGKVGNGKAKARKSKATP